MCVCVCVRVCVLAGVYQRTANRKQSYRIAKGVFSNRYFLLLLSLKTSSGNP